jgi:hypothetical protein
VAEKTAVFGGMALRKRGLAIRIMAFRAEFLSLFFGHFVKIDVDFVMGESGGGFLRGVQEKQEKTSTEQNKNQVVYQGFLPFFAFSHLSSSSK